MLVLGLLRVVGRDFLNRGNHFCFIPIRFIEVEIVETLVGGQVVIVWGNGWGSNFGSVLFMRVVVGGVPAGMEDDRDCGNDEEEENYPAAQEESESRVCS
jgi:hypothetical protein